MPPVNADQPPVQKFLDNSECMAMPIAGLVGFMGNGDLWGLIFTHKSEWGFMGMNGDL